MLHIHGGGWVSGEPEMTDLLNEALSQLLNLAIVSVDYRLAPENPYPAGPDDCEAAALWLIDKAAEEYGTGRLLIGGESAGAHLSAVTLLRLRDRHGVTGRFCGANLVFGAYDLGHPPSAMGVGLEPGNDLLDPEGMLFMVEQFLPGTTRDDRRAPDMSPLFAELSEMPRALFTVGTSGPPGGRHPFLRVALGRRRKRSGVARLPRCTSRVHRSAHRHEPLVAPAPGLLAELSTSRLPQAD